MCFRQREIPVIQAEKSQERDEIKNGTAIKVTEVLNDSTLLVEELNSLII